MYITVDVDVDLRMSVCIPQLMWMWSVCTTADVDLRVHFPKAYNLVTPTWPRLIQIDVLQFNFHWQMGRHLQLWHSDLIQFNFHWQMGRHLQLWRTGEPDLGPPKVCHLWAGGHEALLSLPERVVLPQVGNIFELCVMINLTWFSWWGPVQTMWGRKVTWDEQLVLQEPVF